MFLLDEIRKERIRSLKTLVLMLCWLALGMSLGVLGPTLLDLQELLQTDTSSVAFALSARSGGYAAGSFLMGVIATRVNFQLATTVAFAFATAFTLSFGYIRRLWLMLTIFIANGICLGFFESGSNVFLLQLWGKETAPFMQALHFSYGIGSLIAPLIAEPFLIRRNDSAEEIIEREGLERVYDPDSVMLYAPYSVIAAFLAAGSSFMFLMYRLYPETEEHPSRRRPVAPVPAISTIDGNHLSIETDTKQSQQQKHYNAWKIAVIVLSIAFMHIYYGLEISFGSFLMTYAVNCKLKLTKATGAHLTTLFWSCFTFIRIVTVFLMAWIGNAGVMAVSLSIALAATAILLPFGNSSETMLWIGVALIGIGVSSVWACVFGFLEETFAVSGLVGSLLVMSAVLGEFVFPVIISAFVKDFPQILLYVVLCCSVTSSVLFALIFTIATTKLNHKR